MKLVLKGQPYARFLSTKVYIALLQSAEAQNKRLISIIVQAANRRSPSQSTRCVIEMC